jgi:hypothetical protein
MGPASSCASMCYFQSGAASIFIVSHLFPLMDCQCGNETNHACLVITQMTIHTSAWTNNSFGDSSLNFSECNEWEGIRLFREVVNTETSTKWYSDQIR